MLCLRMRIDIKSKCTDFIRNVYLNLNEALEHQDIPFEKIVKELRVEYDPSRSPLFQASINFISIKNKNLQIDNNIFNLIDNNDLNAFFNTDELNSNSNAALNDLNLNIVETDDNFELKLIYATSIFKEETAKDFLDTYILILEQFKNLTNNSSFMLYDLKWISNEEESKIINEFKFVDFPSDKMIYELFEEQVELNPNNTALVFNDIQITYKKLNERSNILAHFIKNKYQIKGDDLIGLILERNEYMILCILAVLKSGGAYVPIDPDFPIDRIKDILDETKVKSVIFNKMNELKFKDLITSNNYNFEIVEEIQIDSNLIENYSKNLRNNVSANNLAYVIFTSGSTGKPKGVAHTTSGYLLYAAMTTQRTFDLQVRIISYRIIILE